MKYGNTISSRDVIKQIEELQSSLEDALQENFDAEQVVAKEDIASLEVILMEEYQDDCKHLDENDVNPDDIPDFTDWLELPDTRKKHGLKIEELEKMVQDLEDADLNTDLDDIGYLKDIGSNLQEVDYSELEELISLLEAAEEAEGYNRDWYSGCELIASHYFTKWVQQYAEETTGIDFSCWPCDNIDWEQAAKDIEQDYAEIDFNGQTYYIRCT